MIYGYEMGIDPILTAYRPTVLLGHSLTAGFHLSLSEWSFTIYVRCHIMENQMC